MKTRILTIALAWSLGVGLIAATFTIGCGKGAASRAVKYHCPMHPTVVSDKKGSCPICGMDLVLMADQPQPTSAAPADQPAQYHCPMHPTVVSDKKGSCPICGMDLVPIEKDKDEHAGHPSGVPGLAAVSITPDIRQRMGLTTGVIEKRHLARDVRTSARIVADETRLYHVTTKIDGWIEKLFTATIGQFVKQGEPLFSIYSPELVAAQQELLTATQSGVPEMAAAARERLTLWDVSAEQIDRLLATRKIEKTLTLYAPASGSIMERRLSAGHRAMAGEVLMTLADLSSVWADADIYQSDLAHVQLGMAVELTLPYWPEKRFVGKVTFLSAALDPASRTLKARIEVPNPDLLLKPEMFGVARLKYDLGEGNAIPEAAVMRTGEHTYAFKEGGAGRLIPVEIEIGPRADGYFQLLGGLNEGDKVVTSANFLVDSESALKAALAAMAQAGGAAAEPATGGHQH
jgi:membrane fusion protein, copper/silver efflux system